MDYYKISKDSWQVTMLFDSQKAAEQKATELGDGYTVEFVKPYVAPTAAESLAADKEFCGNLVNIFLEDNRLDEVTQQQSELLMVKFSAPLSFAQVGAVSNVRAHLENIEIDEVFTQARKDKYLNLIAAYQDQF